MYNILGVLYLYYNGSSSYKFMAYEASIFAFMVLIYLNVSLLLIYLGIFNTILNYYPNGKIGQYLFAVVTFTLPLFLLLLKVLNKERVIEYSKKIQSSKRVLFYKTAVLFYFVLSLIAFIAIAGLKAK